MRRRKFSLLTLALSGLLLTGAVSCGAENKEPDQQEPDKKPDTGNPDTGKPDPEKPDPKPEPEKPTEQADIVKKAKFTGKLSFMGEFDVKLVFVDGTKCKLEFSAMQDMLNKEGTYTFADNTFKITFDGKEYASTYDEATGIYTINAKYKGPETTIDLVLTWNSKGGEGTTTPDADIVKKAKFTGKLSFMGEFTVNLVFVDSTKCKLEFSSMQDMLNKEGTYTFVDNTFKIKFDGKEYASTYDEATGIYTINAKYKGPQAELDLVLTWNSKAAA